METEITTFKSSCKQFVETCEEEATMLQLKTETTASIARRWVIIMPCMIAGLLPLLCTVSSSSTYSVAQLSFFGINVAFVCPVLSLIAFAAIIFGFDKIGNQSYAVVHALRVLSDEALWLMEHAELLPAPIRIEALATLMDKKSVIGNTK